MVVISPCDAIEAKKATVAISKTKEPTYLRCTRNDTPLITTKDTPFDIGKAHILFKPENGLAQVGIIATGPVLYDALMAAKKMSDDGIKVKVMNLSTIKPLDKESIVELAKETRNIITIEDHQISGGMGSAVAECLAEFYPTKIKFMGINDSFGQSGESSELARYYKIDIESIIETIKKLVIGN
jgi:transketolase